MLVPTNAQRRATAKQIERQLERRAKQAKRRRILTIVGGSLAAVAVIVAVVVTVVVNKDDRRAPISNPTDSASTSPRRPHRSPAAAVQAVSQPRHSCQYRCGQDRQTGQIAPGPARYPPTRPRSA